LIQKFEDNSKSCNLPMKIEIVDQSSRSPNLTSTANFIAQVMDFLASNLALFFLKTLEMSFEAHKY